MNKEGVCNCFQPENSSIEISDNAYEEEESNFAVVARIWWEKMIASGLFLHSEIDVILPVWIDFTRKILSCHHSASAEDFYISAATICAQQLKHFSEHGWQCLLLDYSPTILKCFENSLEEQEVKEQSLSSDQSLCDVHSQVEFLLQLIASSNISLFLVRKTLSKAFTPNFIFTRYPHNLYKPRNYLDSNLEILGQEQIRKKLINGDFDEYILPLQVANEVHSEFWEKECADVSALPRFSRNNE